MDCRVTVHVDASPDDTWGRLVDVGRWPEWNPSCVSAEAEEPLREGSRMDLRLLHPRGRDFYTRPRVARLEAPRAFAWRATGPGLRADTELELAPEDGGTRVTLTSTSAGALAFAYRLAMRPRTQARLYLRMLDGLATAMAAR